MIPLAQEWNEESERGLRNLGVMPRRVWRSADDEKVRPGLRWLLDRSAAGGLYSIKYDGSDKITHIPAN